MKRTVLGAIALYVASIPAACAKVEGKADVPARPVRVTAAAIAPAAQALRYSATIQPDREVAVAFKVSGYVDTIAERRGPDGRRRPLQAGDTIAAGTVLARLREADHLERLNQAGAGIREIQAAYAKAEQDLSRARSLFESRSLTRTDLDAAQAAFDACVAQLAAARASEALARIAVNDAAIAAPFGGVVIERRIETGALVSPGSVAFTLARIDPVKAVIGVPDTHLRRVTPGQRLRVSSDAMPSRVSEGIVTSLSPSANDQNRLFAVEVSLDNADGAWRPGMIASVELAPDAAAGARGVAVPLSSIVRSGADAYGVVVIDESGSDPIARARRVDLGDVRANAVVVRQGLQAGERVVTSGPGLLVDGERVRIIP